MPAERCLFAQEGQEATRDWLPGARSVQRCAALLALLSDDDASGVVQNTWSVLRALPFAGQHGCCTICCCCCAKVQAATMRNPM